MFATYCSSCIAQHCFHFQHTLTMDERDNTEFPTQGHFIKLSQVFNSERTTFLLICILFRMVNVIQNSLK